MLTINPARFGSGLSTVHNSDDLCVLKVRGVTAYSFVRMIALLAYDLSETELCVKAGGVGDAVAEELRADGFEVTTW